MEYNPFNHRTYNSAAQHTPVIIGLVYGHFLTFPAFAFQVFWPITEEPVIYGSIAAQLKNRISEPVETLDITLNVFTNGQV